MFCQGNFAGGGGGNGWVLPEMRSLLRRRMFRADLRKHELPARKNEKKRHPARETSSQNVIW
jgi:hypothetical protein